MSAMSVIWTIARATFRALLGRRRTILMVLVALVPVLVALLSRVAGDGVADDRAILSLLIIRTVLPLTALVFGTTALGSELDDGTGVALLTKPIPRWQIVLAKIAVAGIVTAVFTGVSAVVTGFLLGTASGALAGFAIGVIVGSFAYAAAFVAISVITTRALVVGLVYTLLWEGWLAGILPGTKSLSLREATLGVIDAVSPPAFVRDGLDLQGSLTLIVVVLVGGTLLAAIRLARYQVKGGD